MPYSRTPITVTVNDNLESFRQELNAATTRLNELFNASDELQPRPNAILDAPTASGATITDSTIQESTIDNTTLTTVTIENSSVSNSTLTNPVINDATFNNIGTAAARNIGTGSSDVPVYSDLEAATASGTPSSLVISGAYLGQVYYDNNLGDWYIWNGSTWDQLATV